MTIRRHIFSCDCGESVELIADSSEDILCGNCGEKMWVNFSHCNIGIDRTECVYSRQFGYIESSSDRRRMMKERGLEEIDFESALKINEDVKQRKAKGFKDRFIKSVTTSADYLRSNNNIAKQIAAEQKNTGKSATAKKISEVVAC